MPGGTAIVPADSPHYRLLRDAVAKYTDNIVSFGFSTDADVRVLDHVTAADGGSLIAKLGASALCYTLSQPRSIGSPTR